MHHPEEVQRAGETEVCRVRLVAVHAMLEAVTIQRPADRMDGIAPVADGNTSSSFLGLTYARWTTAEWYLFGTILAATPK